VLGVSECSDLAVIDIEGEGYPYFEWHDGAINTGIDVYAAGFTFSDPEFTLTRGIVSKAEANGETPWASVDAVLEHDATINPGNSGGPLVGNNSKVVGVNYAGISWYCPASADGSPLSHGSTSQSSLLVLDRAQVAQRGVPPTRVVEALDVLEDSHPHALSARPRVPVQELAF
jgi:hypothetical protein